MFRNQNHGAFGETAKYPPWYPPWYPFETAVTTAFLIFLLFVNTMPLTVLLLLPFLPVRDDHNKRQQEVVRGLQRKNDRELQAVLACPTKGLEKKKAAKKSSPSTVLKPQAVTATTTTTTPIRPPSKKQRTTSKPQPVTPTPQDEDESSGSSTEVSVSGGNLFKTTLRVAKTSKFSAGDAEFSLDLQDDYSVLTDEGFLPGIMSDNNNAKKKNKVTVADYKLLKAQLQEKEEALEEQGLQLHASYAKTDELETVLKAVKAGPGGKKLKEEAKRLCHKVACLQGTIKNYKHHNDIFAVTEEKLKAQIKDLQAEIKGLQAQISAFQANGEAVSHTTATTNCSREDIHKLQMELKEAERNVEKFKSKFSTIHTENQKNVGVIGHLKHEIRELKKQVENPATATTAMDESLALEVENLKKENTKLTSTNETLKAQLKKARQALKDAGKKTDDEVVKAVVDIIKKYVREVAYRKYRFAVGEEQQEEFCRAVYDGIKSDPQLRFDDHTDSETYKEFDEFKRVYDASCRNALNTRRQYTQTLCQNAVTGEFFRKFVLLVLTLCVTYTKFVYAVPIYSVREEVWPNGDFGGYEDRLRPSTR